MIRVLAQRLTDLMVVLWGVSALVFLMIRFIPGDAVQIMLGANVEITPERLHALYQKTHNGTLDGLDALLDRAFAAKHTNPIPPSRYTPSKARTSVSPRP